MIVYLIRYSNPVNGGYFAAQDSKPIIAPYSHEERWAQEVAVVEDFPDDVWELVISGGLPVDPDGEGHDLVWEPWWEQSRTLWRRRRPPT